MVAWADGYTNMQFGANVAEGWKTPNKALGHADGNSFDVVVLGRRGRITLTFSQGIADGTGFDFAVFENSVSDTFLELAWVEVSSDGIHFVRFPNYSYTGDPVPAFGAVDPTFIYGLAGKYRQGYGTPFDLAELQLVADAIQAGSHDFTAGYVSAFTNRFQYFDASSVHYVRIVDIAGDGLDLESEGYAIYDPYPTAITAGFDLDAVGVMNQPAPSGVVQMISFEPTPHQKRSFGSVELDAVSDSGLPVSFSIPPTWIGLIHWLCSWWPRSLRRPWLMSAQSAARFTASWSAMKSSCAFCAPMSDVFRILLITPGRLTRRLFVVLTSARPGTAQSRSGIGSSGGRPRTSII